ncbi:MAG TPA: molybdopterin-dependent oxidoreductase [Bryobacteraceae bacterium]|nr:molybdopterin-dependent oxidoreductase [Bryobacteraceae bacterium]
MPEIRHSVCALDCPDACGLLVQVEDGRGVRLRGNPDHPVTRGFLCAKVTKYLDREYSPDRLLYPMKRTGPKGSGSFARISWEEALDTIAGRLQTAAREFGPESVLPYSYAGSMGLLNANGMDRRFFHRIGASRLDRTICASAGAAGLMKTQGFRYGVSPEDFVHARFIIAWGANVLSTNVHLWPFLVEARRSGAKLVVIDPHRNRTAAAADQHLFIHPGSDKALALGLLHVIFRDGLEDADYLERYASDAGELRAFVREYTPERVAEWTGIDAETIVTLAREYATTRPSVIRLNYGVQRNPNGGTAVQAITMLPVVTGAWRELGGGAQLSTAQAFHLNRAGLEMPELQRRSPLGREARLVNMSQLGAALTELDAPPVKAMVVYCSNPGAVAPDQGRVQAGLRREDLFTVVIEQFQTDTADFADIVLPSTTFLEHTDLYTAYGHYYLQLARPALPAPGETKSNVEIFQLLARRMGLEDACLYESEDMMIRTLLDSGHPHMQGITLERLEAEHQVRLHLPTPYLPFAEGGFGGPEGKAQLGTAGLAYEPPPESRLGREKGPYPLELISPKAHDAMNSTFGNQDTLDATTAVAWLHTEDARERGIADGDAVRLFNARGEVRLRAAVDGKTAPGVVAVPAVRWPRRSEKRAGLNTLVSDRLTDLGGGATFYSCLIQVERCAE